MVAGSIGEWAHRLKESYVEFLLNQLNYINNLILGGLVICDLYRKMKCFFCINILWKIYLFIISARFKPLIA